MGLDQKAGVADARDLHNSFRGMPLPGNAFTGGLFE